MNELKVLRVIDKRRKLKNIFALSALYLIALIAIAPLFLIFSFLKYHTEAVG